MIILIVVIALVRFINVHKYDTIKIEDNYYAVLHAGSCGYMNSTYLYIINGKYKYIQVQSCHNCWGSYEATETVTKVGKLNWPQDVIDVAKKNGSDGWVTLNVDIPETQYHKRYNKGDSITIDEFRMLISIK